ncbi:nucleoside monophosphate kinase [Malacoplasma penetrans]|uniref:Adenylate kinase n=1 Tax=Malacoplasma penetrans (strain HF-2) TaxID=272633 RepID=KAD_MALP2|nr:nucleoside monophosphate kinase [Malacoplasma penetrans]Q8EUD3.1 RecName: Full=Adenylate kinase; Short=AK; AltName: Full=ATP-AMP transphosphorylase; AltName: Full=ATP:AMP phosphotransferase; AltName: Full=Adenylate monophosphate kinase [Malacoplasma penetrans HF-2]RXY96836.1 nucleoside monophosphate kinase [Malacoplasma penetrans]BAC44783.1 adenylate kinase [Malacoplasma penetrans HF-2]
MKLVLLGAPGCGKGTISDYLVKNYGLVHLSTGDIFRQTIDQKGPYWEELKSYISKGLLVPDELTNKILKNALDKNMDKSFILDGCIRTIAQADFLSTILDIDLALYLEVPFDVLEKRLTGRRICSKCKRIYNIHYSAPKKEDICDDDGEFLIQRKDDQKEIIDERMKVYRTNSEPLIKYYEKLNKLVAINSENLDDLEKNIDDLFINKFNLRKIA